MKLSVVIPAHNEEGNIGPTLNALRQRLAHEGIGFEIVVVDDGSTDTTPQQVQACCTEDPRIRFVCNTGKHGFGWAVRCGLDALTGDAVVLTMADGSDDPEDVVKYYYTLRDKADCAFGSRFIQGSYVENYPRLKLVLNRLANLGIRLLFGLRYNDITNAFKGYRAYVIEGCRPFLSPHFNLTVEMPLKAVVRGYSFAVVPISWHDRKIGRSSFRIAELGSRYLYIILNVWLEKMLTKGDYHRPKSEVFVPWPTNATTDEPPMP